VKLVRLLGPIDVVDDTDSAHAPGSALRRTLLAVLALHTGQVLSPDWLLEHVWDAEPPSSGVRALRFHISQLRKEIGSSDLIETVAGGYRLTANRDQVDALNIDERAREARRSNDPHTAAEQFDAVLAMWRGTPFIDCAPCAALDDEGARLDGLHLTIVEEHLQARLDSGAGREVIADLIRATSQHPLREGLWAMLMTAQYRAGQQAAALRSYEQLRTLLADSLGLDPSIELQDLQRRLLQHDPTLAPDVTVDSDGQPTEAPRTRHRLPVPAAALIDSTDQVGTAKRLLRSHRLVTLTGAGGIGKTRLAVELGWSCLDQFDDGVWMIELAPVANPESIPVAVASTLSIPLQNGMTHIESIIDWLSGRHAMLILDNCEHVLDGARPLLSQLVAHCPTMTFVATSRQPLDVSGERVLIVNVLSPDVDAVALFLDRSSAADSSFIPNDEERGVVAEICRRLDGLPLAIELAAARIRSMTPTELLERLDDRFELLRRTRGSTDHHDVLQATVEWSYRLLDDRERAAFDQLSVFAGSFDLRAAAAVLVPDAPTSPSVIEVLIDLVDKSMIVAERQRAGTRYRLLETMRQFGAERLRGEGGLGAARDRHLRHYVNLAEETNALFLSPRQVDGAEIFEREWHNFRLAHARAVETGDLGAAEQLVIALHRFADSQNRLELGQWLDQTLALAASDRMPRPHTFALGAFWAYATEDDSRGDELLARGTQLAAGSFDDPGSLMCLTMAVRRQQKDAAHPEKSRPTFMQVEEIASRIDLDQEWWVLIELADHALYGHPERESEHLARLIEASERLRIPTLMCAAALESGPPVEIGDRADLERGLPSLARALSIARGCRDVMAEAEALRSIARANVILESSNARAACREALARLYEIRYWLGIRRVMESCALHLVAVGQLTDAAVLLGNLEAHHSAWGAERILGFRERSLQGVASTTDAADCMARGAALDRHEIVEYALTALDQ
jgi:predicted ATPase/DNA-binding SARP family transcriptional activator